MTLKLDWKLKGSDFEDMGPKDMSNILRDISDQLFEGVTSDTLTDYHKVVFLEWKFTQ